jgi:hypothetical protein
MSVRGVPGMSGLTRDAERLSDPLPASAFLAGVTHRVHPELLVLVVTRDEKFQHRQGPMLRQQLRQGAEGNER